MKRLIVTADDLGAAVAVNQAIVRAHREGAARFASLMVAEDAAEDAVERVRRECPSLGVGLHVVLAGGKSLLGRGILGDLVDSGGSFPASSALCGLRYFFDSSCARLLEMEMRAQFERFLAMGFAPSHADGHMHMHMHPVIFPVLMRLCREYGFRRVRLPRGETGAGLRYFLRKGGAGAARRVAECAILSAAAEYLWRCHGDPRIRVPDRVYGQVRSGAMEEEYVLDSLKNLPDGLTEVYFHPSMDDVSASDAHRGHAQLQTLVSSEVSEAIRKEGILLEG